MQGQEANEQECAIIRNRKMTIQLVPITDLIPTVHNTRTIDPKSETIDRLAKSMASIGLLQPVICRPHKKKKGAFELVAGEQRFHAAKKIGWTDIPAAVDVNMTDAQAIEITATENMNRKDLTPIEEAKIIGLLHTENGWDFETVGAKLGRSASYCARRHNILELSPAWMKKINGGAFSEWSARHFEIVAVLIHAAQDELLGFALDHYENPKHGRGKTIPQISEWRGVVSTMMMSLEKLPWDIHDETLDPKAGSCSACPKQTGKESLLFEEDDDGKQPKSSQCMDRSCFETKLVLTIEGAVVRAKDEFGKDPKIDISDAYRFFKNRKFEDRVLRLAEKHGRAPYHAKMLAKPGKGTHPCVIAGGSRAGKIMHAKFSENTYGGSSSGSSKPKKKMDELSPAKKRKVRLEALEKRRQVFAINSIRDAIANGLDHKMINDNETILMLAISFGFRRQRNYIESFSVDGWKTFDGGYDQCVSDAWDLVSGTICERIDPRRFNGSDFKKLVSDCIKFCNVLKLDFEAAMTDAHAEIKDPKWLQAEKSAADSTTKPKSKKPKPAAKKKSKKKARRKKT